MVEARTSFKERPDDWIGEQADYLLNHIQNIISKGRKEDSPLTHEQLFNIVGHALIASEYLDSIGKDGETLRGAFELLDSLGLIVGPLVPIYREDFENLSSLFRKSVCGAQYRVRRALEIPEIKYPKKANPENREIFIKLAAHAYSRDHRFSKMFTMPDQELPRELIVEISDWLINTQPVLSKR